MSAPLRELGDDFEPDPYLIHDLIDLQVELDVLVGMGLIHIKIRPDGMGWGYAVSRKGRNALKPLPRKVNPGPLV